MPAPLNEPRSTGDKEIALYKKKKKIVEYYTLQRRQQVGDECCGQKGFLLIF